MGRPEVRVETNRCGLDGLSLADKAGPITGWGQLADGVAQRQGTSADTVRENWRNLIPEGRLARPEELGDVIAFLASPAASYVRGVSLAVDGGRLKSI